MRKNLFLILCFLFVMAMLSLGWSVFQKQSANPDDFKQPLKQIEDRYMGRQTCAKCHAEQDRLWRGSHHDLAMQEANEQTILGDFRYAEFSKDGVISKFFQQQGRFWVNTDGPDGELADFEIKYTFGVMPLQQYLIELPGGRLQAFSIAWDSRAKEQGGQRWFHLYPSEEIDYKHELHWTKHSQNWNFMCAECHSTNLQKNYDPNSRSYRTQWSEIDVACEACHGPAARHVIWAEQRAGYESIDSQTKGLIVQFNKRNRAKWKIDPVSGNAQKNVPHDADKEIQVCARCHSRRVQLFGDYRYEQLMDTHQPLLLQTALYHTDGQIKDEVYEYGSFLQSKMYQAGVTCSDCHEPHSLKLRAPDNEICLQCHAGNKYDTKAHHFHDTDLPGSRCIDCHMPANTYMVVDSRRDHGFRIPRPDLSEQFGTPNPCIACHVSQSAFWATDKMREWYGHPPSSDQSYAETLHATRSGAADALERLITLLRDKNQPTIVRATAIEELNIQLNKELLLLLIEALRDPDPLMRNAGLKALEKLPPERRWTLAHERLSDPVRSVRAMAASILAEVPTASMSSNEQADFRRASDDYLSALRFNADDPDAQVSLGNFYAGRGESTQAEQAYREALLLDPNWIPAYVNFADFLRHSSRDDEGEALLRTGLSFHPKASILHHSLGLLQVRKKDFDGALISLQRSVELAPEDARFSYVYAVALYSAGQIMEARSVIKSALLRVPNDLSLNVLSAQLMAED